MLRCLQWFNLDIHINSIPYTCRISTGFPSPYLGNRREDCICTLAVCPADGARDSSNANDEYIALYFQRNLRRPKLYYHIVKIIYISYKFT